MTNASLKAKSRFYNLKTNRDIYLNNANSIESRLTFSGFGYLSTIICTFLAISQREIYHTTFYHFVLTNYDHGNAFIIMNSLIIIIYSTQYTHWTLPSSYDRS